MLKAVQRLVVSNKDEMTVGNHSKVTCVPHSCGIVFYRYHSTAICVVNYNRKEFFTDNGGWNTSSTTRAINDYKHFFGQLRGFTEKTKAQAKEDWGGWL